MTEHCLLTVRFRLNKPPLCHSCVPTTKSISGLWKTLAQTGTTLSHMAKLVYRAYLLDRYIGEWFVGFWSKFSYFSENIDSRKQQISLTEPLGYAIRKSLEKPDSGQLYHSLAYIHNKPRIAASGIIMHPPMGTHFRDFDYNRYIPVSSSPVVVTVLPAKGRQVVMFSYTLDGMLNARFLLDGLEYHEGTIGTARLSKKLLEEMEVIHISPRAWKSLSSIKQNAVKRYFHDSMGRSETDFNISPARVDLFTN